MANKIAFLWNKNSTNKMQVFLLDSNQSFFPPAACQSPKSGVSSLLMLVFNTVAYKSLELHSQPSQTHAAHGPQARVSRPTEQSIILLVESFTLTSSPQKRLQIVKSFSLPPYYRSNFHSHSSLPSRLCFPETWGKIAQLAEESVSKFFNNAPFCNYFLSLGHLAEKLIALKPRSASLFCFLKGRGS